MQSKEEVLSQVFSYISQSMAGIEVENSKIDFKTIWYKLTEPTGINEFIKDTSAIANSFGPDGMIIIGYDDKKRELTNVKFSDCGLRDSSQLPDLINKRVDRLFHFNLIEGEILGFNLSIIHIPPSIDKPHVIRNYQTFDKQTLAIKSKEDHKIFIRRGSSTYPAGKSDLELMYYDRKNIQPDYNLLSTLPLTSIELSFLSPTGNSHYLSGTVNIIMENTGRRPVSIDSIIIELSLFVDPSPNESLVLKSSGQYINHPIILQSGELKNARVEFITDTYSSLSILTRIYHEISQQQKHLKVNKYELTLSNGESITSAIKTS